MDDAVFDFFSAAVIPVFLPDVPASAPRDVHFPLVPIAAVRTISVHAVVDFHLAVVSADLAEIGFRIELGVHDVVVYEFHDFQHGFWISGEVGGLDVADGSTRAELLEFRLQSQFVEGADLLEHWHVVGIRYVSSVFAVKLDEYVVSEALFQASREFVRRRFHWRAVQ